ncbi:hypothetical protein EG328_004811 [Venturia inaequalis]|uniref:Arrestin-like N-terminal domain-containing protein n=1 Tax=Venturia inaequalis TaxID=5025 RepID=A0A8H3UM05_VENIN|nr:hypothetical protein EG328_004811 [Venturia inaequalis]
MFETLRAGSMGAIKEDLKLDFEFTNTFSAKDEDKEIPVFLRHRGIQGTLKASKVAGSGGIEKVKLVLKGYMLLKLMDVQDSVSSRNSPDNDDGETFQFNFPLAKEPWSTPQCDEDDEDGSARKYLRTLPSSINVFGPWCTRAAGQACCQAEVRVKYEVEATAYRGDTAISKCAHEVRIYDSPDSHPPPVHMADFPDEYHCSQEKRLKRFRIPGSRLTVIASEPKPLEIRSRCETSMAAFPLKFIMRDSGMPPRKLDVRINSLLKAVTFISASKLSSQPTIKQSKESACLAAVPKFGRAYHRSLHLSHWTRHTSSPYDIEWVAHAMVWLPITENATPAPTFFTPYLSRRYSVSLRMEVKGEGKAFFSLNVPLQIVYPMDVGSADAPSYEVAMTPACEMECEEEEVLPIYVR